MEVRSVLVTGAAGGVGRAVCRVLLATGLAVRGLVRPEDDVTRLPLGGADLMRGYVEDPAAVAGALCGLDAVVNCAALLPRDLGLPAEHFRRVNVDGAVNVLRQASLHGVRRAVFFSTISVVDHVGRHIDRAGLRDYVRDPHDPYLASKIDAEKALAREAGGFAGQVAVLRPAFVYGPGNYAVWQDALGLVERGRMALIGKGDASLPLIYAEDIAHFILHLFRAPAAGPAFDIHVLASPERTTLREVFTFIAERLGAPPPRQVPYLPVRLAAALVGLLPRGWRRGRLKLLTPARVRQYSRGYDLSGVTDPPPLGFVPPTRYREGLARMLDDYRARRAPSEEARCAA